MFSELAILSTLILSTTAVTSRRVVTNSVTDPTSAATSVATSASSATSFITTSRETTTTFRTTGTPTLSLLVGDYISGWAGSIVSADACATTIALACAASDSNDMCSALPDGGLTITNYPSAYDITWLSSTSANGAGAIATLSQNCTLTAPYASATQAVCAESGSIRAGGGTAFASTVTSAAMPYAAVPITAGASKLPSGSPTCTDTSNAAAPIATEGLIREVCKVIVPLGAAAVAGALF